MQRKRLRGFLSLLMTAVVINAYAAVDRSALTTSWGYKGNSVPERWGLLDPQFAVCMTGKEQSPINLIKKVKQVGAHLMINYHAAPIVIMKDGNTSLTIGANQIIINDGHTIQMNFSKTTKENAVFQHEQYHLVQIHFHSPSENQWRSQSYPLEIHFVHQNNNKVLMVGVLVKGGAENPELNKILAHLPNKAGKEFTVAGNNINPAQLMPAKNDFYYFDGSLTTPPCTEGVQWVIMANAITASPAQIALFRKAIGGSNARPVQPLNHRVIYYSSAGKTA